MRISQRRAYLCLRREFPGGEVETRSVTQTRCTPCEAAAPAQVNVEERHLVVLAVVPLEGLLHHQLPMLPCCPLLGPGVSLSARSTVGGWSYVHDLCFEPSRLRRPEESEERASEPFRL